MKDKEKKSKELLRAVVTSMINREARGWPPDCAGFIYQPARPRRRVDESKK